MFMFKDFLRSRARSLDDLDAGNRDVDMKEPVLEEGEAVEAVVSPYANLNPDSSDSSFTIEFDNIGLQLKNGTVIMEKVTGSFKPGRMCAIMGPSGAGKTTIISLVTGKAKKTSGKVVVNGTEMASLSKFKKLCGFVPQEDVMLRELTVYDNILFSARYRLPASLTYTEVEEKVRKCIDILGLSHIKYSIIGDERSRGISGGQRKRVNIGIELVADPSVLFLDEPTSGLDSTSSTSLCATLKAVAKKRAMTIAAVIHQPSISAFLEFDDLLLLGKGGRVVYHGPGSDAEQYFTSIGFQLPPNNNPADFYMDVMVGAVHRPDDPEFKFPDLFEFWENKGTLEQSLMSQKRATFRKTLSVYDAENGQIESQFNSDLVNTGKLLTNSRVLLIDAGEYFSSYMSNLFSFAGGGTIRRTATPVHQFLYCLIRGLKQNFRSAGSFILEICMHFLCGAIIATVGADLYYVGPFPGPICAIMPQSAVGACKLPQYDSYQSVANFMCFAILFASIASAAGSFGNEQVNYWRECATGLNSVSYFFAKWVSNFPRIFAGALAFYTAFQTGYRSTGTSGPLLAIILLLYWFGFSLGFLVSQLMDVKYAPLVGVLLALLFAVVFSGISPSMVDINEYHPEAKKFPWQASGPRWAIEAFYVEESNYYREVPNGPYKGQPYMNTDSGLDNIGYSSNSVGRCQLNIFFCGLAWGGIALFFMLVLNRSKKV